MVATMRRHWRADGIRSRPPRVGRLWHWARACGQGQELQCWTGTGFAGCLSRHAPKHATSSLSGMPQCHHHCCCLAARPVQVGGTLDDSEMVDGLVLDHKAARAAGGPTRVENAKIALVQFQISPPKAGRQVGR